MSSRQPSPGPSRRLPSPDLVRRRRSGSHSSLSSLSSSSSWSSSSSGSSSSLRSSASTSSGATIACINSLKTFADEELDRKTQEQMNKALEESKKTLKRDFRRQTRKIKKASKKPESNAGEAASGRQSPTRRGGVGSKRQADDLASRIQASKLTHEKLVEHMAALHLRDPNECRRIEEELEQQALDASRKQAPRRSRDQSRTRRTSPDAAQHVHIEHLEPLDSDEERLMVGLAMEESKREQT